MPHVAVWRAGSTAKAMHHSSESLRLLHTVLGQVTGPSLLHDSSDGSSSDCSHAPPSSSHHSAPQDPESSVEAVQQSVEQQQQSESLHAAPSWWQVQWLYETALLQHSQLQELCGAPQDALQAAQEGSCLVCPTNPVAHIPCCVLCKAVMMAGEVAVSPLPGDSTSAHCKLHRGSKGGIKLSLGRVLLLCTFLAVVLLHAPAGN